jgi:hypothetical protein
MATIRKEFTDIQKATFFARDRATCCFSGANLWLLDAPLRPGYQRDWADHVRPSARGGASDEENGVYASHTFNAKKRHNSADTAYLFERGLPTSLYFETFGPLSSVQSQRLSRLSKLIPADWFFNRSIGLVLHAFDYRVGRDWYDERPSRDDKYWLRAALRKLANFQSLREVGSLDSRGIIHQPDDFQQAWLELRNISTERELLKITEPLFQTYRANALAWAKYFWDAKTAKQRLSAVRFAERSAKLTHDTLKCIQTAHELSLSLGKK